MVGRISLSLVALFGVWMLLETTARGQNLPKDRQDNPVLEEGFSQPVFLAPKRTQMRMLVNARKLLELQRYSQAVRMLHRVLIAEAKESRDEDYFFLTGENEFETDRLQSRLDLLQATSTEDLGSLSVGDLTLRRKFLSIKLAGSNLHINDLQEKIEKESPPSSNDRSRRQLKALLAQQTRAKLSKASYEQQIAAIDSLKLHPGPQPQTDAPVQSSQLRKQVRSHQSLRTEARRLLGRLPEAARESYELQFGIDAQQMLDRAVEAGNIEAVAEVQRRYFHTRAGYQAMMLLGHYHLDQDAPIMAALCFREVYESPVAAEYEPAISMLLATALQQSGQTEEAEIVLFLLQEKYPQKKITIGGQVLPQSAEQEDPLAWLAGLVGQQTELQDLPAINWTMFRGNAARTAVGSASRPLLLRPLWRQRIAADADSEQDIAEQSQQYADRTVPAVPALQPLAVGEVVFMRTPGRLAAVDLESGKLIWQVETTANEKGFDAPVGENIGTAGKFSNATLRRRVWLDKTFGSMSSDGERLFVLEEFGSNDNASERVIINRLGKRRFSGPQYNVLAARSVSEAQGKLLWSLGGPHAKDPEMKKAFFLGPPLPLQGRIYQLVELAGEVRLLVLDSRNGEQLWSQQLAVVQQSERFMGKRRTGGISPSYAEGVLICPTGVGGIVAVDLMTRNLRWGHQYPEAPALRSRNPNWNRPTTAMALPGPEEIWADSCAIISDGFVLVTPAESNHLHCLSLQDGTPLWRVEREKLAYLAGVHAGKAILIGTGQITAIDMRTGKVVDPWPLPLPSGSLPSGRGYQAGDRYYLPLRKESKGEVISVDLKNAKIVEHSKSGNGTIPGNLICHRRLVISQNSDWLQSFHQLQPLKADVAQTLSENPRDPVALLRRGEILVDEDNSASAVELFRTAAGLFAARADDFERQGERASHADALASAIYARQWLFQGLLDGIKKDFEACQDSIPEIETLITGPRERIDYLRVVAAGYDRAGQIDAALDTYFQLVKLSATENPLLSMDSTHSVRLRHWVRRRLDALQDRLSASQSERFDQQVLALQREVLGSAGIEYLQSFNFYFGAHPTSAAVKQEMVGRLTAAGERLERIALLEQLANTSDPARQRAAAAQLALLYEELANFGQAAEYFHQLRARWPNEVCWQGKTGAQLFDSLATDSPIRQRAAKHRWPTGKVLLKQGPAVDRARHMGYQPALPVKMLNPNAPAAGPVIVDQKQSFRISGMDHFGKVEWSVPLDQDKKESRMSLMANPGLSCGRTAGPLLVVAVGQQVMAIDTLKARHMGGESPILWRQDTLPAGSNARAMSLKNVRRNAKRPWTDESPNQHTPKLQISRIGPITDGGVTFVRHRDLISVDPTTGEVLWTRKGVERESQLFGDQQLIMVLPPGQKEVQVLSAIDGRLLGVREVPAEKDCWTTVGRHILVWRKVAGVAAHWELAFYDPWTQEDVWTHPMSLGTKGQLVGGDAVALFEKTKGRFVVLDLFTGERLVDELLDPDPQLKGIYVVRSRDFYMLVTNRGAPYNRSSRQIQIQPIPNGVGSAFISGSIYAFDRLTGKPLWDLPAKVQQWGLPRQQPVDLPVLVFSRRVTDRSKNRYHMSFLFMDKRTGRLVVPPGKRSNREYNFEIEGDAEKNIVSVLFKNSTLSLQFTDTPVPPAGPVQLPAEALVEKGGITSVIGAVLKAIGKPPAIPGAEDLFEGDAEVIENDKLPK